jgi:hypothetical protein
MVDVQVMDEEGQPYAQTNIDYRCRIHRPKRPKDWDVERLEGDPLIRKFSAALIKNDVIQMQYLCGDIFAGVVVENRKDEETVLVQILPHGYVYFILLSILFLLLYFYLDVYTLTQWIMQGFDGGRVEMDPRPRSIRDKFPRCNNDCTAIP